MKQPCYNYLIFLGAILLLALCSLLCLWCQQLLGERGYKLVGAAAPTTPPRPCFKNCSLDRLYGLHRLHGLLQGEGARHPRPSSRTAHFIAFTAFIAFMAFRKFFRKVHLPNSLI